VQRMGDQGMVTLSSKCLPSRTGQRRSPGRCIEADLHEHLAHHWVDFTGMMEEPGWWRADGARQARPRARPSRRTSLATLVRLAAIVAQMPATSTQSSRPPCASNGCEPRETAPPCAPPERGRPAPRFRVAVETRTDRGAADGEFLEGRGRAPPARRPAHLHGVAGELLPQRQRRGVHQVSAGRFSPRYQRPLPWFQGGGELLQRWHQFPVRATPADVKRGGNDVVGRLAEIDVVVRMQGALRQKMNRPAGGPLR